jgi:hypothetical protein
MRGMRLTTSFGTGLTIIATLVAALGGAGCSSGSGDDASKFVGTWMYNTGSTINAACTAPLPPMLSFDLTGQQVTITKVDDTHIKSSVGQSCTINFTVSGAMATAAAGQICMLTVDVGGTPMNEAIMLSTWVLTASGTALSTTLSGTVAICTATGSGTLSPSTTPADGGLGG